MIRAEEPSPLQLIRDALPTLAGGRRRVAEFILAHPEDAGRSSITRIAAEAQTQPVTVSRLSTGLGYPGFPAFRAAIASEHGRERQAGWETDIGPALAQDDAPERVLTVMAGDGFRALRNATAEVDISVLTAAAESIAHAKQVEIFAEWGDRPPADELAMRLRRIGVPVWNHEGAYAARVGATLLDGDGVAMVFTRSGESDIAAGFLQEAAARGATTVIITGTRAPALGVHADHVLFTGTEGGQTWMDYFAGRTSDHFVGAVLWVLVAQRLGISFVLPS